MMQTRKRRRKQFPRWDGPIGIGDRVAFQMPGEDYVVAGNVEDITGLNLDMLVIKMVTEAKTKYTMVVQRGLVVENKSEVFRQERRARQAKEKES